MEFSELLEVQGMAEKNKGLSPLHESAKIGDFYLKDKSIDLLKQNNIIIEPFNKNNNDEELEDILNDIKSEALLNEDENNNRKNTNDKKPHFDDGNI